MNKRVYGINRLILLQFFLVLALSTLLQISQGWVHAYSALLGGLVCIIPTGLFAWIFFRYQGARAARQIVWSFYWGEAVKIAVSVVLFVMVFKYVTLSALSFFGAYLLTQLSAWLAPLVVRR